MTSRMSVTPVLPSLLLGAVASAWILGPSRAQAGEPSVAECPALESQILTANAPNTPLKAPRGFDSLGIYDFTVPGAPRLLDPLTLTSGSWTVSDGELKKAMDWKYQDPCNWENASSSSGSCTVDALFDRAAKVQLGWTRTTKSGTRGPCRQDLNGPSGTVLGVLCDGLVPTTQCTKGLGDVVVIDVMDLDTWLASHKPPAQTVREAQAELVLFLDGQALTGITPLNPKVPPTVDKNGTAFTWLYFKLARTPSNAEAWTRLLKGVDWDGHPVYVTVGFPGGDVMPSLVIKDTRHRNLRRFVLRVLPHRPTLVAAAVLLSALMLFIALAFTTPILKNVVGPLRPDNESPYSLARLQMAIWFFLVVGAYVWLFLVTQNTDTLTGSVLILMGISATTALGSTIIDAAQTSAPADRTRYVYQDRTDRTAALDTLTRTLVPEAEKKLFDARAADSPRQEMDKAAEQLAVLTRQRDFFKHHGVGVLIHDLLGDEGQISFQRFQILVWTLVLGIVFVMRVWSDLAMPEFSATTLGLMGISAGTYVGFKLPTS